MALGGIEEAKIEIVLESRVGSGEAPGHSPAIFWHQTPQVAPNGNFEIFKEYLGTQIVSQSQMFHGSFGETKPFTPAMVL